MDPITLMMIAGGGLLGGGLFGAGKSIWGDDNDYTMEGNLNKNSEAWKQYQRFSNLDSDFYQKGDERIRRTMGDLGPRANDFMTMMGSKNFSNAQALSNIKSSQTKTNEQAGQAVINLQMEGIKHAMTPLEMAYKNAGEDVGQKRETQSQKTNFFNEMANMGTGLLSAGVMSGMPKPDTFTPSGATSNLDILGGISGKNFGSSPNPSSNPSFSILNNINRFNFGEDTNPVPTSIGNKSVDTSILGFRKNINPISNLFFIEPKTPYSNPPIKNYGVDFGEIGNYGVGFGDNSFQRSLKLNNGYRNYLRKSTKQRGK